MERRDFLKTMGVAAAGIGADAVSSAQAAEKGEACAAENPYGGGPGTGITLPPYYRPTPYLKNNNFYFPGLEQIGPDEMRISFVGSCPFPARKNQAGTAIMVELGNGDKFFFDFGSGCMRNIIAMQVPLPDINNIFLTHLHVDHYADLPYMLPFTACFGRYFPLQLTGPSGRTPELGTKAMVKGMKEMLKWHLEEFETCPVGDGYDVDVNEFDHRKENEVCYDKNGATVRHWPRSHGKDGASAYRLDWNGLSFVWTGDGRPDELTAKYAKGVDVFVSEVQNDIGQLMSLKQGVPPVLYDYVIDTHHTVHYAAGYLMKQVNPRIAMVTHLESEPELDAELIAGIRTHWPGLFVIGTDVKVVNVTKDAIWCREAVLPELGNMARPDFVSVLAKVYGGKIPDVAEFPPVNRPREAQQDEYLRKIEIDPAKYYPNGLNRPMLTKWPGIKLNIKEMMEKAQKPKT